MVYKRAWPVVAWWEAGGPVVRNYLRGTTAPLTPDVLALLTALSSWRTLDDLGEVCAMSPERLEPILAALVSAGLVDVPASGRSPLEAGLSGWHDWDPSAAHFHFGTKDMPFADREAVAAHFDVRLTLDPPPPRDEGAASVLLPTPEVDDREFPTVLRARRSWRRFGEDALSLDDLGTLLGLTWGTQEWMDLGRGVICPLKTSPSGGACHSLEVYVVAERVDDLPPGLYRYLPDAHGLQQVGPAWSREDVGRALGGQSWAAGAAACFFMTSVFERVQWKYRFARAYRTVLLEAGHFCQTFCLTATWLHLAPFCTAALADSLVEQRLGIDGVRESVVYAMGVGTRPEAVTWAPFPDSTREPPRLAPRYRARNGSARESHRPARATPEGDVS